MPQETIQLSVPDMQCSGCEADVSIFIKEELEKIAGGSKVETNINSREKIVNITITSPIELDKNQLSLDIKAAIFQTIQKKAYTMGCNLEIITEESAIFSLIPDKWFLIKPSDLTPEWCLFQVDPFGKTKRQVPLANIPGLLALLEAEPLDENKVRDHLFLFQMNHMKEAQAQAIRTHWNKTFISLGLSAVLIILSAWGVGPVIYLIAGLFSTICTIYLGKDTYDQARQTWRVSKRFNVDSFIIVSTVATLVISLLAVCVPGLPWQPMFDTALLVFGFKHFGTALVETKLNKRPIAHNHSDAIPLYHQVNIEENENIRQVAVGNLNPGDTVLLKQGERIPVDGEAGEDLAIVSTLSHHGHLYPVKKPRGALLHAGMLIHGNDMQAPPYKITVTKTAKESYLMNLDRESNTEAMTSSVKAPTLRYIFPFLFGLTLLLAGIVFGCYFPVLKAIQLTLCMLISFCPCTIGLVRALTTIASLDKLEKKEIITKDRDFFEKIQKNRVIAFDLVGTLTCAKPKVVEVQWNEKMDLAELKRIIFTLEKGQEHSVATAIADYFKSAEPPVKELDDPQFHRHFHKGGISASMGDFVYYIGNENVMKDHGIPFMDIPREKEKAETGPVTQIIYVGRKKKEECKESVGTFCADSSECLGVLQLTDPLRPEVIPTLLQLQAMGKELAIFTGSSQSTLEKYLVMLKQHGIAIQKAHAECVNSESEKQNKYATKKERVQQARKCDDNLIMVGEGENDALVMRQAGVGIAMKCDSESSVTQSKAHLIIPSIDSLLTLVSVANQKETHEQQNMGIVVISSLIATLAPILGITFTPVLSPLMMFVSLGLVLGNNAIFKRQSRSEVSRPPLDIHEKRDTTIDLMVTLGGPGLYNRSSLSLADGEQKKQEQATLHSSPHFRWRQIDPCLAHSTLASYFTKKRK